MPEQRSLFDQRKPPAPPLNAPDVTRFQGALVGGAIGDALGWPTEFQRPGRQPPFKMPVRHFVAWHKLVGGRFWGYRDDIGAGEYSDDTQLALSVARSISTAGDFQPERFAYFELPLWLHYERGGGRSVKTAARNILARKVDWLHNFYKGSDVDYRSAGANGAAMRNLPIALVSCADPQRMVRDSFLNSITTHGHPRAILGSIMMGAAIQHALTSSNGHDEQIVDHVRGAIGSAGVHAKEDRRISQWIEGWEKRGNEAKGTFKHLMAEVRQEADSFLQEMPHYRDRHGSEYYRRVGAFTPATRGSGISTVCAAIFLFFQRRDDPAEAIFTAVNELGSDTDTIAAFAGSLLGARHGLDALPVDLVRGIQDRGYLLKVGQQLRAIATGESVQQAGEAGPLVKQEALLRILAWEVGLHEMFWDAIEEGGMVVHPTLGRGRVGEKSVRKLQREGYAAKLIHIDFECGQTCVFHSRVAADDTQIAESLAPAVEKALFRKGGSAGER